MRRPLGGASAGAGLAAALALLARERGEIRPVLQLLSYPMLDDRTTTRTDIDPGRLRVWSPKSNRFGWRAYLGPATADGAAPALAAPARYDNLSGLPPAWIGVGTNDLCHDEDVAYARRLAGNDDMAIIRINDVPGWSPRNWVHVHASADTTLNPEYTIVNTFNNPVGTRVCISGSTSGTDCGDVVEVNWDGTNGLSRAQYCSDSGDSGGAIYSGHNARGIHIGVVPGHDGDCLNALFQTVREAASKLNVYVVTS